ncbi:hypothetical protein [Psychrilyobacter atlanticus]|uniref:hypothetical protein n=1 Tax=Psychrilyobacter atlanticus TaxID=271091 RepID=UPI000411D048|nr:hypothetical protein [Psychrilyobacter atlanticus]
MHLIKKEVVVMEDFFYNYTNGVMNRAFLDQDDKMFLCWANEHGTLKKFELSKIRDEIQTRLDSIEINPTSFRAILNYSNKEEMEKLTLSIDILNEVEKLLKS